MATALSSYFDSSFKSYFLYSTSQTNTTYSITVTEAGVWQECTWSEFNWKTVLSATGYDARSNSIGVTYWKSGYHALITTDKTYTFERKTSAYTVTISAKSTQVATGKNATASKTFTVPALPSYKVYYNANGGTGAPSTQTKWYGKTLTLSSTKPTRSGYTFAGWGTSTTDTTADWSAGGSYTANASVTLYAIWKKTITLSYNANGGSDAPSSQSATVYNATTSYKFTISSTKPTRTGYTFLGWSTSSSATSASYLSGSSITLSSSKTLYAVWKIKTYTVSYNANGGSNAPSSQTKTYGVALKISSTKPTRTGYNFLYWKTDQAGDIYYFAPGETTSYNGNQTLVAQWQIKTYTVTYNANGGSNAPSSQTKTYGTDLKLTTAKPTRTNYNFKGWATSSSSNTVSYAAGGTYKTNSSITLYAVWELAYIAPRITSVSVKRCDSSGNLQDDGTYALVKFKWATDETVTAIKLERKETTSSSYTSSATLSGTGKSGSVSGVYGDGGISIEKAYHYRITVTDSKGSSSYVIILPTTAFTIDLLAGGKGVAIGKKAELSETFESAWDSRFYKEVQFDDETKFKGNAVVEGILYNSLVGDTGGTITGTRIKGATAVCRHDYGRKRVDFTFYAASNATFSSNEYYTIFTVPEAHKPNRIHALQVYCSKQINARITTSGDVQIRLFEEMAAGYDIYITGFWYTN